MYLLYVLHVGRIEYQIFLYEHFLCVFRMVNILRIIIVRHLISYVLIKLDLNKQKASSYLQ